MMWLWLLFGSILFGGFMVFTGAPYLPSKRRDIRQAFTELYPLGPTDVLVDIGAGDGIVLRVARQCGAKVIGYEINPLLVLVARLLSRHDSATTVVLANFWYATLPADTTVVYTFGESRDIKKMYAYVQKQATAIGRPLAFISYGFAVPGEHPTKQVGASFLYTVKPLQELDTPL